MTSATVAAILMTHQRCAMLRTTLHGLLAQERPVNEIVVIDNASTDGTAEMLQEEFPTVTHLRMEENVGPAGALEVGLGYAARQGHGWAWIQQDDIFPKPEALATLLATTEEISDNRLGLLACWFEPVVGHFSHNGALWKHRPVQQSWPEVGSPAYQADIMTFKGTLIALAMVPEIGLPIGDYFLMNEEYEWCLRARRGGWRHYVLPVRLMVPLEGGVSLDPYPPWRGYYQVRNHLAMALDHRSPGELLWFLIIQGKFLVGAVTGGEWTGERVRLRLLGAWHGLRGVTGKTIDPARWSNALPPRARQPQE